MFSPMTTSSSWSIQCKTLQTSAEEQGLAHKILMHQSLKNSLFQGHYLIEKAYDRKFWFFHVNTLRNAQLISIQLLHTIRHFYGRLMLGYQKNVKVRVNHLKVLIFQAKYNPCNIQ